MADQDGWILVTNKKKNKPKKDKLKERPINKSIPSSETRKSQLSHQNWNNNKPKSYTTGSMIKKYNAGTNKQKKSQIKNQLIEDEKYRPKEITRAISLKIQQKRVAKKWTQKQLAEACHLHVSVIKRYESGKGTINNSELQKIYKSL